MELGGETKFSDVSQKQPIEVALVLIQQLAKEVGDSKAASQEAIKELRLDMNKGFDRLEHNVDGRSRDVSDLTTRVSVLEMRFAGLTKGILVLAGALIPTVLGILSWLIITGVQGGVKP